jgi:hypothetical protein
MEAAASCVTVVYFYQTACHYIQEINQNIVNMYVKLLVLLASLLGEKHN